MLIHPLAVHFPLALWLTSTLFDVLAWRKHDQMFFRAAGWLVGLGLLGAAVSIAFGWVDLLDQERQGVGPALLLRHRVHSLAAYLTTAVYLANALWRRRAEERVGAMLLALALFGAALVCITGYLGGTLRDVM